MQKVEIIAACSDLGVHITGARLGPDALLKNIGKVHAVRKVYMDGEYQKEIDDNNKRKNLKEVNRLNEALYKEVSETLKQDNFPLAIGGDHSIAIASSLASIHKYQNLGIIWFDAHGDFHTFQTTSSGNIHGLPLAALTNYENALLTEYHEGNYYPYKNVVLLGARDIDEPGEMNNLKESGVTVITTEDIKKYGIEAMCEKAFQIASHGTNGIHVSYDLDVIDPLFAPGVSIPAGNGLNEEEAKYFLNYILKHKECLKSFDLVELNPLKDIDKKTEMIATDILNILIKEIQS